MFIIKNKKTKEFYNNQVYNSLIETSKTLLSLNDDIWEVKKIVDFTLDQKQEQEKFKYIIPNKSIINKIKFGLNQHVLIPGKVQSGKLNEKLNLILHIQECYNFPVILLFRNSNADYHQFIKRFDEFNFKKHQENQPTIKQPVDILQSKDRLQYILKESNLILGLANPDTLNIINDCLSKHPDLMNRIVIINDEADLNTFELSMQKLRTKTENIIRTLFNKIYMFFSFTGTPGSILLCNPTLVDKIQTVDMSIPDDYHGIKKLTHIVINNVKPSNGGQYNPLEDKENLKLITQDCLQLNKSTLLISVSKLCKEHKSIIEFLCQLNKNHSDIVYFELNEKSVKIYNSKFQLIENKSVNIFKGKKVAPIDQAIEDYKNINHIVIVAGFLAGRGVSFVSSNYDRHLTHQYLSDSESTHLESAMQSIRLCGRYKNNPKLTLYCSQSLYEDLIAQDIDMDKYIRFAADGDLPSMLSMQKNYEHNWFANRKIKGSGYTKNQVSYNLIVEDLDLKKCKNYNIESLLTNRGSHNNIAHSLLNGKWSAGKSSIHGKERVIFCNPLQDFTLKGFEEYQKSFHVRKSTIKNFDIEHPHLNDIIHLYKKFPHYEGRIIRKKDIMQTPQLIKK